MNPLKLPRSDKFFVVILTFLIVSSFSAVVLTIRFTDRLDTILSERALCQRVIQDRLGTIKIRTVQAKSARIISEDKFQSDKTRRARLNEAKQLEESVADLRVRVDPENGGKLVCKKVFPNPGIF